MCGRFWVEPSDRPEEMRAFVREMNRRQLQMPSGDITPGMDAATLLPDGPTLMRWGAKTNAGLVINARSETAREKPLFKASARERRLVVPASGFYEWRHVSGRSKGVRHTLALASGAPLYMAGLWIPGAERDFVILTRAADDQVRPLHDRMPLIMPQEALDAWLSGSDDAYDELLAFTPPELRIHTSEPEQISLF